MTKKLLLGLAIGLMMLGMSGMANAMTIDGTIGAGEWSGATIYTIGNGGGTAYFRADQNYIYAAFDITGWTAAMGVDSGGNLLGFGVWGVNGGYGTSTGIEFQQATDKATWGGDGPSGTVNGLESAYRLDAVLQGAIPGDLAAADSFATGHRVWEVQMSLSHFGGLNVGDTIYVVGGINYDGKQHWYPDELLWDSYGPVMVEAGSAPVPEPSTVLLIGAGLVGLVAIGRKKLS